jgi:hypothetical protein
LIAQKVFGAIAGKGGLLKDEANESLNEIPEREAFQARG